MKLRYGLIALPMLAAAIFLCTGCGTANEEDLNKGAMTGDRATKEYKSYGEKALEDAKKLPPPKAKAGAPPQSKEETPKSEETKPKP